MLTLTWPTEWYKFTSSQFNLRTIAFGSRSSLSPRRNTRLNYQVWQAQITHKPELGPSKWAPKEAFFARLDGEVGLIRITDSLRCQPTYNRQNTIPDEAWSDDTFWSDGTGWLAAGLIPPTALLSAAVLRGASDIVIEGLPINVTAALAPGDLIELRPNGIATESSNLYAVVRGSDTNASGEAGVEIRPRLRQGFAAGDMVVLHRAHGVFQLTDADQGIVSRDGNVGSFGFGVIEYVA